jgi:WD40 repeat protein
MFTRIIVLAFLHFVTVNSFCQIGTLETVVQKGHSAVVKAMVLSSDGSLLATASRDKSAKIWETTHGFEIRTFLGHEHTVNAVDFSNDRRWLATSSADRTAKIWDTQSGKEIFSTEIYDKYMTDVSFSADANYFIAAGYSDSAGIYDIKLKKLVKKIAVNADQGSGYGSNVAFSHDGKWLAIGEDNKTVNLYSTIDWKLKHTFSPREGWCGGCGTLVAFSKDSKTLIQLSKNDTTRLYDLNTYKQMSVLGTENDKIQGLSVSQDGEHLLIAADNHLSVYKFENNKLTNSIDLSNLTEINDAIFSYQGNSILVALENQVLEYDLVNAKILKTYTGLVNLQDKGGLDYNPDNYWESYIAKYLRLKNPLVLSKNGKNFFTGKFGHKTIGWNIASGQPEILIGPNQKAVICFDLNKSGDKLLTGDASGDLIIWDVFKNIKLMKFVGHKEPVFDVKFSPDETQVMSTSWDGSVIIWDVNTGKQMAYFNMDNSSAFVSDYTPDGLYIVTGRFDKSLEMREPDSKSLVKSFIGHTDVISSIDFGPFKHKMLTASWDGTARIWDINTGLMLQKFKGHKGAIHVAKFTPDGKAIITGGDDRIIRIWDIESGKVIKTFNGHQAEITAFQLDETTKMLISASIDGIVKCWDFEKGTEFYEHIHIGEHEWMVRNQEGYFSATSEARKAIHFVKGIEVLELDQFFETYFRPDLLPQMFKERGSTSLTQQSLEQQLQKSPIPTVKMFATMSADGTEAELSVKMIDEGGGVNGLKISHNGKIISLATAKIAYPIAKGNFTIFQLTLPLVTGNNIFTATVCNKYKMESTVAKTEVYTSKASHQVVCHVMAIGIDRYINPQLTLNYAKKDAESFVEVIKNKSTQLFSKVIVHQLYDYEANKKQILDTLTQIANVSASHDVFVFYYAGHGSMVDNQFYFIPVDCPHLYHDLEKKAISAADLQEKFKQIKALKQIIIMDACQSGASVELLAMRGAVEEKAIAQLSRSAGIHVLASAGGEQNAKEIATLKHGLFTYVLLEALSGKADGAPKDGKITIYELKSFLDDQVPELNDYYGGKLQFPYTFSRGQDFPIVNE